MGLVLVAGVLLGSSGGADGPGESFPPARNEGVVSQLPRPRDWGASAGGLAAALTSDGSKFAALAPVRVRLWVKNVSPAAKQVEHCGFWPNHYLRVTDGAGRAVATTKQGALVQAAYRKASLRKCVYFALDPGAVDDSFESYDLRDYFELPTGQIHVECESWLDGQKLLSNRLVLFVEP